MLYVIRRKKGDYLCNLITDIEMVALTSEYNHLNNIHLKFYVHY